MSEKFIMKDGFESDENKVEKAPLQPFVVVNFEDPTEPIVLYRGEASGSDFDEARRIAEENGVQGLDNPQNVLAFEEDDDSRIAA